MKYKKTIRSKINIENFMLLKSDRVNINNLYLFLLKRKPIIQLYERIKF